METVSIDRFGRVVVPKPMRDQLGLDAGADLTIEVVGDELRLVPVTDSERIEQKDGVLVYTGEILDQIKGGKGV
ncbi:MAG: AbrB/MazE/SpoVT family DNA-binding domain-containing protein [Armatimonadetes bacterium]|nr:AbrB/MazE/SpoVT family DNA-binding domain-containing protein [Armatimonadota bacterium]